MGRPMLLLDVDGPLNAYRAESSETPLGYETFNYRSPRKSADEPPIRVWLNPAHGAALRALTDVFDLVWATTWTTDANSFVAPKIGLPELPVIDFDSVHLSRLSRPAHVVGADRVHWVFWKTPAIAHWSAGRPLFWFDDDIDTGDELYLDNYEGIGPHRLHWVDPSIGIVQDDLDAARAWAESIADIVTAT